MESGLRGQAPVKDDEKDLEVGGGWQRLHSPVTVFNSTKWLKR